MTVAVIAARRTRRVRLGVLMATLALLSCGAAGCSSTGSNGESDGAPSTPGTTAPAALDQLDTTTVASTPPAAAPAGDAPSVVASTSTAVPTPTSAAVPTSTSSVEPTTTSGGLPTTRYVVPVADPSAAGWGDGHSGYPATDIFAACGAGIVSPVDGVATEVRVVDSWDAGVDNPATRGGRSVTIIGDDGVRYYLAHFDEVDARVAVGERVAAGQRLGTVGLTGRTSGCHLHFAISPPCPGKEWSVRRGVIPPKPYLDAWRDGRRSNPLADVLRWLDDNPGACADAMSDPFAGDS